MAYAMGYRSFAAPRLIAALVLRIRRTLDNRKRRVQFVTLHLEDAVEPGAIILKCDMRSQLQQLFFRKKIAQACVQIFGNVGRCVGHRIGQFDHQPFLIVEDCQVTAGKREQLLVR